MYPLESISQPDSSMNMQSTLENALLNDIWLDKFEKAYLGLGIAGVFAVLAIVCAVGAVCVIRKGLFDGLMGATLGTSVLAMAMAIGVGVPGLNSLRALREQAHDYSANVLRLLSDPRVRASAREDSGAISLDLVLPPSSSESTVVVLGKTVPVESSQPAETIRVHSDVLEFLEQQGFRMASNVSNALNFAHADNLLDNTEQNPYSGL